MGQRTTPKGGVLAPRPNKRDCTGPDAPPRFLTTLSTYYFFFFRVVNIRSLLFCENMVHYAHPGMHCGRPSRLRNLVRPRFPSQVWARPAFFHENQLKRAEMRDAGAMGVGGVMMV